MRYVSKIGIILMLALLGIAQADEPTLQKHIIPIYGNTSLGYYYANLYIGTPAQQQSVIVDTGSGQLALPCSKCTQCGNQHIHRPFELAHSSTSKIVTCQSGHALCKASCGGRNGNEACTFSIAYAEGSSLNGILIEDEIKFERDSQGESIKTTFGCTTRQTNLFYTQAANGIFGLAPHRNAKLLDLLYEKHTVSTNEEFLFSMCLAKNGGQISVGKVRDEIHDQEEPSVKTTFSDGRNLYSITKVGTIRVNNTDLRTNQDLGYYGLFIDSGSTFTYFPRTFYQKLLTELENSCAYHNSRCLVAKGASGACFRIQPNDGKTIRQTVGQIFPSVDIDIDGSEVKWEADKYFLLRSLKNKEVCLGIEQLDRFLLGANWMVDRDIVFNLKEKTVEIFSNSNCSMQAQGPQTTQELAPYIGTGQSDIPLSYIAAVLRDNQAFFSKFLIFIMILVIIVGLLFIIGRNCKKVPSKAQKKTHKVLPQQESDTIKSSNILITERDLSSNDKSEPTSKDEKEAIDMSIEPN